jgi:hypothetical protein
MIRKGSNCTNISGADEAFPGLISFTSCGAGKPLVETA